MVSNVNCKPFSSFCRIKSHDLRKNPHKRAYVVTPKPPLNWNRVNEQKIPSRALQGDRVWALGFVGLKGFVLFR